MISLVAALLLQAPEFKNLKVTLVKVTATDQKAAVTKTVKGQLEPMKGCYDLALKDTPDLKGEIQLELSFEGSTVSKMSVAEASPLKDQTLGSCLLGRLGAAQWPKVKAGTTATVRVKLTH